MAHTTWVRLLWKPDGEPHGLHPDDLPLVSEHSPRSDFLAQVGRDEDYLCLRYSAGIIRVKPEAVLRVKAPELDYGDAVSTLPPRTPASGVIHRIEWQPSPGTTRYHISVDGKPRSGSGYRHDELKRDRPTRRRSAERQFPFHMLAVLLATIVVTLLYAFVPDSPGYLEALRIGHPALAIAVYTGCLRGIASHLWGHRSVVSIVISSLGIAFVILLAAELATRLSPGGLWAGLAAVGIYELTYWVTESLLTRIALRRWDHA